MSAAFDALVLATEAQRRATTPGHSAWVEANAGTGKTKVLTDRVTRLLLDGVKPERKPPPEIPVAKPPLLGKRSLARTDAVLYVAISSLVISIAAMFFSIVR